ncbi:MAG: hypothetical protein IKI31_05775, partial [Treponema sp.]|nr:hypothetical protein [Treponema sp.]
MTNQQLDPSIEALLAEAEVYHSKNNSQNVAEESGEPIPLDTINRLASSDDRPITKSIHEVDLSLKAFRPIEKILSDEGTTFFDDTTYYKTALSGENESAQRVHTQLSKYLTCQDPKDRTVYRQNIISAFWELLRGMASKTGSVQMP